ncbi:hypothetical protein CORC01_06129 [Colletotrichum orchidophilum]|uniref:RZ-type domain-containing protein n=1 Tax=Colletotrichum orchidophilum TaxID=1209926 RepID=A0A1G4BAV2_9PEZI|nr:uncharacterized protein CORC01_06129 [Colletotrichum orchidophilum]OHE98508.1 hypothetical protein CORC01_06129 [Colletotrichum orchidophilum]
MMSSREEYLPVANPAKHHLQGLLERYFRLLREDTLHDLRSAIRTTVESNGKAWDVRTRVVAYENALSVDLAFDKWFKKEDMEKRPRYSLPDDGNHAYVYLHLVDTSVDEVERSLRWFKTMRARQHRRLLEFPSILLPSFVPPLKALQNMSRTLDLPFQEAILNSLSTSFAMIQGPPGTGRSYTGEALIKVLLANESKAKLGPILCVCYTNHALDQLLEHLLDGEMPTIIRVGSRSRSERLAPVNLRAVARDMTRTTTEGRALYNSIETLDSDANEHKELMGPTLPDSDDEGEWQTVSYSHGDVFKKWLSGGLYNQTTRPLSRLYHLRVSDLYHQECILLYQNWFDEALREELEQLSGVRNLYQKHKESNSKIRSSIDLRSTPSDTRLETARANPAGVKYSLDVSLFERLVHPPPNTPTIPFSILDTQRQMHPSIAELVRSTLYPSLLDSGDVRHYPEIPGMAKRLFWLHHESPESGRKPDKCSVETSYSNNFEIELVSGLVSHLLRQGVYKSEEIAVLTPYLGQLNKLRQKLSSVMQIVLNDRDLDDLAEMESSTTPLEAGSTNLKKAAKTNALSGVRAATVDNFQGEEANVVIVPLVRSNNEKRCGFLTQDDLRKMENSSFSFPTTPLGFALRGSRQQQMNHLFKLTGDTRHKALRTLRYQITNFLGAVRRDEQPYQRVAHLVWHVNKRRQTSDFSFDESAIQMGALLEAMTLSLRCDLLLVSDYISLCRNNTDDKGAKSAHVDAMPYIKDCERLIHMARTRNFHRLEVEGHIFLAMFCYFAPPNETESTTTAGTQEAPKPETNPEGFSAKETMIKLGEDHLRLAKGIIQQYPSTATLMSELETANRMLHQGIFYSEVPTDEMRAVYAAISKEFSGTGHWYTCRNGHPFTIGECGMAMQQTVCPECNAPVGGRNHSSAEVVQETGTQQSVQ